MGRIQMDTSFPTPSQVQPQSQTYSYPPPPQTPPQQFHHPPKNAVPANYNPSHQQGSYVAAPVVSSQSVPVIPIQAIAAVGPNQISFENSSTQPIVAVSPNQPSFQNNVATGFPIQASSDSNPPMPSPQTNGGSIMGTTAWTTGLFDCMEDPTNALTTALFPCVTFGQIAEVLDGGHTTCATSGIIYVFTPCFMSHGYRRKLRRRYGLVEAPASDWITHSVFEFCSLCQEYRELNNRGVNPALGWHGNMNNHQNEVNQSIMVAPKNQIMK